MTQIFSLEKGGFQMGQVLNTWFSILMLYILDQTYAYVIPESVGLCYSKDELWILFTTVSSPMTIKAFQKKNLGMVC